jgi:ribosomal protein S18 acetylase RimI-like enzyme
VIIKNEALQIELNNQNLRIDLLGEEDYEACIHLMRASFQTVAETLKFTKETFPASGAYFDKNKLYRLLSKGAEWYGLYNIEDPCHELVGCFALTTKNGMTYTLHKLAIKPSYRHRGYGQYLMGLAEELVIEKGGKSLSLGMVEENTLLKSWYLAMGYKEIKTKVYKKTQFHICFMKKVVES